MASDRARADRWAAAALVAVLLTGGAVGAAAPARADVPAGHVVGDDGRTSPVYSMYDAIHEHVYVQADMDSDGDGRQDLIRADIERPDAEAGVQVPSLVTSSGYNGHRRRSDYVDPDASDTSELRGIPLWETQYLVPRGYAVISVDVAGTNWSEGCADDVGPNDIESTAAVIRWLHHEPGSTAFGELDRAETVDADWSSGLSAVTGHSYPGGIANAVATSAHVPGLRTVIPTAGGSSAYNTRANGVYTGHGPADFVRYLTEPEPEGTPDPILPAALREHQAERSRACGPAIAGMEAAEDDAHRTFNAFWAARDYTRKVDRIARNGVSVLIAAGQADMTVRTNEFGAHWAALRRAGVTSRLFLHLRGHVDPFETDRPGWVDLVHRWLDHALLGIENGVTREPAARVETRPGTWVSSSTWPVASTSTALRLQGPAATGGLALTSVQGAVDSFEGARLPDLSPTGLTGGASQPAAGDDRLVYATAPFPTSRRLSGIPSVTLRILPDAGDQNVSVALIDYGPADVVDATDGEGVRHLPSRTRWCEPDAHFDCSYEDPVPATVRTGSAVIAHATMNTAHHTSSSVYTPVRAGEAIDLSWDLGATDRIVPRGHRLGVMVYGNSIGLSGETVGQYTGIAGAAIDPALSTVRLPLADVPGS